MKKGILCPTWIPPLFLGNHNHRIPAFFSLSKRIGKARVVEVIKKPIFLSLLMVHKAHITREKKATRLRHANSHIGFSFFKKSKKECVKNWETARCVQVVIKKGDFLFLFLFPLRWSLAGGQVKARELKIRHKLQFAGFLFYYFTGE